MSVVPIAVHLLTMLGDVVNGNKTLLMIFTPKSLLNWRFRLFKCRVLFSFLVMNKIRTANTELDYFNEEALKKMSKAELECFAGDFLKRCENIPPAFIKFQRKMRKYRKLAVNE
jgi:hypothetical protein